MNRFDYRRTGVGEDLFHEVFSTSGVVALCKDLNSAEMIVNALNLLSEMNGNRQKMVGCIRVWSEMETPVEDLSNTQILDAMIGKIDLLRSHSADLRNVFQE